MSFKSLSKIKKVDWNFNSDNFEYKKCSEMEQDKVYTVRGCFITPDRGYGKGAVVTLDTCNLNLPVRYMEQIEAVLEDVELQEQIKSGHAGIKITSFVSDKYKKTGYNVEFLDI